MITIRINVIGFIVTVIVAAIGGIFLGSLNMSNVQIAASFLVCFTVIRIYDYIESLPAFKDKKKKEKDGKSN